MQIRTEYYFISFIDSVVGRYTMVFIFDDIWDEKHLSYLKFAHKAVIISRIKTQSMLIVHDISIEAPVLIYSFSLI